LQKDGPSVAEFWGAAQDAEEESMASVVHQQNETGERRAA
jgi:hypothetical protein